MEQNPEKPKNTQIDRALESFTDRLNSTLNPPLLDSSQEPLKLSLDRAFDTLRNRFSDHLGEVVECSDDDMVNVFQSAFNQNITSPEKAIEYFRSSSSVRDGLTRIKENQWIIKDESVLKAIASWLTEKYRTLKF